MRLLLISNSTNPGEGYLDYPKYEIQKFLGETAVKALFIPYAAVSFSYDEYEAKVQKRFGEVGHAIESIHKKDDPVQAVRDAQAIVVGGGNTFHLLMEMQNKGLMEVIREKVFNGTPYIGWSAGSNLACPTIKTTNDMPVVEPENFAALGLVPFQINPHYLDANPEGHAGETREMRLNEFQVVNKHLYIVGLREGTMLLIEGKHMKLIGPRNARIFKYGTNPLEFSNTDDFDFLMNIV